MAIMTLILAHAALHGACDSIMCTLKLLELLGRKTSSIKDVHLTSCFSQKRYKDKTECCC